MAELTAADVSAFTGGRLVDDGGTGEVTRMLNAALAAARREVGWHVSPVKTADEIVVDGPDSRILFLPTRRIVELTSVDEDGTALDPATKLRWSKGGPPGLLDRPVGVRKRSGGYWSGDYQAITVVMTHGYTEDEAVDWRHAIMSMVNTMSLVTSTGVDESALVRKTVDDVTYGYQPWSAVANESVTSVESILDDFKLPTVDFI